MDCRCKAGNQKTLERARSQAALASSKDPEDTEGLIPQGTRTPDSPGERVGQQASECGKETDYRRGQNVSDAWRRQ